MMNKPLLALITSLLLPIPNSYAEVISSDNHGFTIELSRIVNVSKTKAYQQFINVNEWWNSDHTWFGSAQSMYIEPLVGGCFCEKNGEKQALHMTISYVDPDNEMRMVGGLGPLQMLGITGGMSWKFESTTNGNSQNVNQQQTKITFRYQVTGYMSEGLDTLSPIVDKVQSLQLDNLAAKLTNP